MFFSEIKLFVFKINLNLALICFFVAQKFQIQIELMQKMTNYEKISDQFKFVEERKETMAVRILLPVPVRFLND